MLHALDPAVLADNTSGVGLLRGDGPAQTAPPVRVPQAPSLPVCPRRSMGLWGAHREPHTGRTHTACPTGRRDCLPAGACCLCSSSGQLSANTERSQPHPHTLHPAARALGLLPGGDTCQHSLSTATIPVPTVPTVSQRQRPATASDSRGSGRETPSHDQGDFG